METVISFIEMDNNWNEKFLLTTTIAGTYPTYKENDNLALQIDHMNIDKSLKLTKFKITKVIHNLRNIQDFTVKTFLGMEVYVKRIDE